MTPERWREVRQIVHEASELGDARSAFVEARCGVDDTLRQDVERLLTALEQAGDFLEPPARGEEPGAGSRIGPYVIVHESARGGMGVVYQAARCDDYSQRVAIKLVKLEIETESLTRRFREERQALAMLSHPHIARLLDGGTTNDQRPYLVMEWVEGRVVTDYCAEEHLSLRPRLEIFLGICDAVAHAHRNLVVHRDLKPSNILITADGSPKLLDFGIAKILSPGGVASQQTMLAGHARALTPDYASPEQVRGEAVTTATDIYSLGAVLYELMCGSRAHRLATRTAPEIERVVCEQPVSKPSRETGVEGLPADELAGDLDNIILKALEKDPLCRYRTVEEFAGDIRSFLAGRPVSARPHSFWYTASKFLQRNKLAAAAGAVVVASLAAGALLALWQAGIAQAERRIAERRFELARNVAGPVLFEIHDAISNLAGTTKARELLLSRSVQYLDALSAESGSSAALQRDLAAGYERIAELEGSSGLSNLGRREDARAHLNKALALREHALALDPGSAQAARDLAQTHRAIAGLGGGEEALRRGEASLAIINRLLERGPQSKELLSDRAKSEFYVGRGYAGLKRWGDAAVHYRNALAADEASGTGDVALYRRSLGSVLIQADDLEGALQEYQKAASLDEQHVRANPSNGRAKLDLSYDYSDWALILGRLKRPAGAAAHYGRVVAIREEMRAADRRDARAANGLVSGLWRLGNALADSGDRSGSEAAFQRAVGAGESAAAAFPGLGAQALADACWAYASAYREKWADCTKAKPWLLRTRALRLQLKGDLGEVDEAIAACGGH